MSSRAWGRHQLSSGEAPVAAWGGMHIMGGMHVEEASHLKTGSQRG